MATTNPIICMAHLQGGGLIVSNSDDDSCNSAKGSALHKKSLRPILARAGHILKFIRSPEAPSPTTTQAPAKPHPTPKPIETTTASWIFATRSPVAAVKVCNSKSILEAEHNIHQKVELEILGVAKDVASDILLPFVPHCYDFHADLATSKLKHLQASDDAISPDSAAYAMEFIRPFHRDHLTYLIKRHLSCTIQDRAMAGIFDSHFVAKVCLGDVRPLSDRWQPDLYNRNAYVDQLQEEGVDVVGMSAMMGSTLAFLHWRCGVDAAGVRFVLGCERKGHIRIWLTEFGVCRKFHYSAFDVTTQLVDAIMQSDCVWPRWINLRSYRKLWCSFRKAYLIMSGRLYADSGDETENRHLPSVFIDELEKIRGPPRRL
ncbi:hypothetical protein VFPPC_05720 [Pochonia chlamydosporia 170]|uniref:DUF3669 domain-containing protein n=1 Tax=Pochonia chlamydosporia 170 TaxID=1380566 RepID=A0A179FGS0_METCM|nr:hypothetical protein VFPPC_05720 [Pochonia chlamydosporia 170]OAQ64451.2 hypothetical protein VFPPC_05720 [Pochonia chlamydosporia 170]